jgi:CheY-like chemotaxis protein
MESAESERSDAGMDLRVLLLDESAPRRERCVRQLTACGCHVTPVCHSRQALEAASFRRFDIVVLSASLSEFECPNLVDKLRHLLGNLKFVVISDTPRKWSRGSTDADVVCLEVREWQEPERGLVRVLDEVASSRGQNRDALSESEELLGIA